MLAALRRKIKDNLLDAGIGKVEVRDVDGLQAGDHLLGGLLVGIFGDIFGYVNGSENLGLLIPCRIDVGNSLRPSSSLPPGLLGGDLLGGALPVGHGAAIVSVDGEHGVERHDGLVVLARLVLSEPFLEQ